LELCLKGQNRTNSATSKHVKCTTENMITKLKFHFQEGQIYCSGTAPAEHTTADQSGASVLLTDATTDI
jgi:hypothetical protein